eukprot:871258-Prymnesium_polylepis.1
MRKRYYSVSFNFHQLRFSPRGLPTACDDVRDALSSPREADRCAKWFGIAQARRGRGRFRGQPAERCDVALRVTDVSGDYA